MDATKKKLESHKFQDKAFGKILNDFLSTAQNILADLKKKFILFVDSWLDTLNYFGEDPSEYFNIIDDHNDPSKEGKKSAVYIFVSLDLFFQSFNDSIIQIRLEIEKKNKTEQNEALKLKKLAILNSASFSSLNSELEKTSTSQDSIASASRRTSVDYFEPIELELARKKISSRLSTQLEGKTVVVDIKSRRDTEAILSSAASSNISGSNDPEVILKRHSILGSQPKKRLTIDRKLGDIRKSINMKSLKLDSC